MVAQATENKEVIQRLFAQNQNMLVRVAKQDACNKWLRAQVARLLREKKVGKSKM